MGTRWAVCYRRLLLRLNVPCDAPFERNNSSRLLPATPKEQRHAKVSPFAEFIIVQTNTERTSVRRKEIR